MINSQNYLGPVRYAQELILKGTPMIVFDVKTTGSNLVKDKVFAFSGIKVVKEKETALIIDTLDILTNPGFSVSENYGRMIPDRVLSAAPGEEECFGKIYDFFGKEPFVCGYNSIAFDSKFMQQMYSRYKNEDFSPSFHLDIRKMAGEKLDLENYRLKLVARTLDADGGIEYNRPIDDVIVAYRCWTVLERYYDEIKSIT